MKKRYIWLKDSNFLLNIKQKNDIITIICKYIRSEDRPNEKDAVVK